MTRREQIAEAVRFLKTRSAVKLLRRQALREATVVEILPINGKNFEPPVPVVAHASPMRRVTLPLAPRARRKHFLLAFALGVRRGRGEF